MDRQAFTTLMRQLDELIRDLPPGEGRTALRQTFDALCSTVEPSGPPLRRGNELLDWSL